MSENGRTVKRVAAFRAAERAVLGRLTPGGVDVREVRALLKSALGAQYTAWVRRASKRSVRFGIKDDGEAA